MSASVAPTACAIVRFSAVGDVLLTAQAVAALATAWPTSQLIFVTHARLVPLLAGNPHLTAVVGLPAKGSLRGLARELRQKYGVDAVLDLHGSLRSRLLTAYLQPQRRARWQKREVGDVWRVKICGQPYRPRRTMAARLHAAVEALVGQSLPLPPFALRAPADAVLAPQRQRQLAGAAALRVGLSPGAGWASKRWPVAAYAALARTLLAEGMGVYLLGSSAEAPLTAALAAAAPGCVDWAGQLAWPETFATLQALDVLVAGDTGPMHLARGLGVPVIALFTSTPAAQFGFARRDVALQAQVPCSPCSFYGRANCPRGDWACLAALTPATVAAAVRAVRRAKTVASL